jgi:hypothetical protein
MTQCTAVPLGSGAKCCIRDAKYCTEYCTKFCTKYYTKYYTKYCIKYLTKCYTKYRTNTGCCLQGGWTSLIAAAFNGASEVVRQLLAFPDIDVNCPDQVMPDRKLTPDPAEQLLAKALSTAAKY